MKLTNLFAILGVILVLLACGCIQQGGEQAKTNVTQKSTAEKQATPTPPTSVRYVQLNFLDGTTAGGEYISETAAYTTIKLMYTLESAKAQIINPNISESYYKTVKYNKIAKMNGTTISFKNALINTMVDTGDPKPMIEKSEQEWRDIVAADKLGRERQGLPTNGKGPESVW